MFIGSVHRFQRKAQNNTDDWRPLAKCAVDPTSNRTLKCHLKPWTRGPPLSRSTGNTNRQITIAVFFQNFAPYGAKLKSFTVSVARASSTSTATFTHANQFQIKKSSRRGKNTYGLSDMDSEMSIWVYSWGMGRQHIHSSTR